MKVFFKNIPAIAILTAFMAASAFANSVCYELCMSCYGPSRAENCDKIESTCNCPFVIDSARSKNMGIEISKRRLVEDLSAGCDMAVCVRNISFQDGYYKGLEKGRTKLTKLQLAMGITNAAELVSKMQPEAIRVANATVDSLLRRRTLLPIAPMTQECTNRCNTCVVATPAPAMVPTDSLAKAEAEHKTFCQLAETSCQCKAHEQNIRDIEELDKTIAIKAASADSLVKYKDRLIREEMARIIADSVQAYCNINGACNYTITFTSKEIVLLEIYPVEQPKPAEPAAAPQIMVDTGPENSIVPAAEATSTTPEACPQTAAKSDSNKTKDDRIFYKVMEFIYGNYGEHSYYHNDYGRIRNLKDYAGYEGVLNYYLRWYFYDGGAISIGMGTSYHYNKFTFDNPYVITDKINIFYHNIGMDVPISFRLGVPYIPIFKPFISQTFYFHKPIFEIYKLELPESQFEHEEKDMREAVQDAAKSLLGLSFFDNIKTRFNSANDLTFSVWLGLGLQITRHFSAEYQFNFGVGSSGHAHKFDSDNYWRVVVDFAW